MYVTSMHGYWLYIWKASPPTMGVRWFPLFYSLLHSEMSISCFWTGDEANKAKGQFKIIKHVLKAFMLRRTKFLLIESGILALPPLTELTVYGSLLQVDIFPFLCAIALCIFLICCEWFLQDGAVDTVTKEALHVSVAERAANTYFIC
jgi:hypothetical protein